jgi:hypothetical protein
MVAMNIAKAETDVLEPVAARLVFCASPLPMGEGRRAAKIVVVAPNA